MVAGNDRPSIPSRRLAERLRALREREFGPLTQRQLARALGGGDPLSISTISLWEKPNSDRLPPMQRLAAYARLFCSSRSFDGDQFRLLSPDELTDQERERETELYDELIALRESAQANYVAATWPGERTFYPSADLPSIPARRLAERLRALREQERLTQKQLARVLGGSAGSLSSATVSLWEKPGSDRLPPEDRLATYARLFCSSRSFDSDQPRLLSPDELTDQERERETELYDELITLYERALTASFAVAPSIDGPFAKELWDPEVRRSPTESSRRRSSWRAMSIGVELFDAPYERLTFVPNLVGDLGQALGALGYETTVRAEAELASAGLGAAVQEYLRWADPDGVLVVHILTHGRVADGSASVYLVGSDGEINEATDVGHWLTSLQNVADRPLTLFLLDLCQAGTVARLPWQAQASGPVRGWVIAACRGDHPAYDGRFTRAVANVLRALDSGDLDIAPDMQYVPLDTVARAIRREVNRLVAVEDAYPQQVTATQIDISAELPDLPFFRNPAYRDNKQFRLRAEVDPGLLPFLDDLDEGLDARHFVERGAGAGPLPESTADLRGCFTGRDEELRQLSPWLSGVGSIPLHVVTGSPGVGKSALLGVLVCAAHRLLRGPTRPLWEEIRQSPLPIDNLAAVHARSRDLAAVTRSVARQLKLTRTSTAADLVSTITNLEFRPVIVVDAVDEADNAQELVRDLLLPLAIARRPEGDPACRLLVGIRRYDEYAPLLELAREVGGYVDLDDVRPDVLEKNLRTYVSDLLCADARYRHRGKVHGAFATEVARALSERARQRREWGEFLVAGLYTRYLLTAYPEPPSADEAENLGARVPRTLPEVLELDLRAHQTGPLLRQVVTALAHACGQGMPLTVLTRLIETSEGQATTEKVRQALLEGRFYLRQSTDIDGSTLYRLFHQGLADHLRHRPFPELLAKLLSALGRPDARNWQAAEPYLLRHALEHAERVGAAAVIRSDPGFLLQPDPVILLMTLTGELGDIYRASLDTSVRPWRVDRMALARNASRAEMTDIAEAIASKSQ